MPSTCAKVISHVASGSLEVISTPYLSTARTKRAAYIIISSEEVHVVRTRILFKESVRRNGDVAYKGVEVETTLIGSKAISFSFQRSGNVTVQNQSAPVTRLNCSITLKGRLTTCGILQTTKKIDSLYLGVQRPLNTMSSRTNQRPCSCCPTLQILRPMEARKKHVVGTTSTEQAPRDIPWAVTSIHLNHKCIKAS